MQLKAYGARRRWAGDEGARRPARCGRVRERFIAAGRRTLLQAPGVLQGTTVEHLQRPPARLRGSERAKRERRAGRAAASAARLQPRTEGAVWKGDAVILAVDDNVADVAASLPDAAAPVLGRGEGEGVTTLSVVGDIRAAGEGKVDGRRSLDDTLLGAPYLSLFLRLEERERERERDGEGERASSPSLLSSRLTCAARETHANAAGGAFSLVILPSVASPRTTQYSAR